MALMTVRPTKTDRWVANEVARNTNPAAEHAAEAITWGPTNTFFAWFPARQ